MSPQRDLLDFEQVLNNAKVDWQVHVYGNTMHAFTTPAANNPASGVLYNPVATVHLEHAVHNFLDELFR